MSIVYKNKITGKDGREIASVVVREVNSPALKETHFTLQISSYLSPKSTVEEFDTYDGALDEAKDFLLRELCGYGDYTQEPQY